jgi:hypothetical protein
VKAYVVTDNQGGEISEVVFAESVSRAKAIAKAGDWLGDTPWTDLRAVRATKWDDLFEHCGPGLARFDDPVVLRRARSLGWHEYDGQYETCSACGLHEWEELAESKLAEVGFAVLCAGCRASRKEVQG